LDRIGGDARSIVIEQLKNSNDHFRALAVRILRRRAPEFNDQILAMASDASPEVRREVLLAIRMIDSEAAMTFWRNSRRTTMAAIATCSKRSTLPPEHARLNYWPAWRPSGRCRPISFNFCKCLLPSGR